MLRLPDSWVWDAWYVRSDDEYHVFFLYASRALHDPARRHRRASIGHAVSHDLVSWDRVADAVVRGSPPSFDQLAPWTGSIVRGDDDRWYMFYTGVAANDEGQLIQQIGLAISEDLHVWDKHDDNPLVRADPRWYEKAGGPAEWQDEHWRDPWVFRDPRGEGWQMLITARANHGPWDERGVVGHATSHDLLAWTVLPPLTEPNAGFGLLEVPQLVSIQDDSMLVFNCPRHQLGTRRIHEPGGVWVARAHSPVGPFDIGQASLLAADEHYVGKILQDPDGCWVLIAFVHHDEKGQFVGELTDPMPLRLDDGLVTLDQEGESVAWGVSR